MRRFRRWFLLGEDDGLLGVVVLLLLASILLPSLEALQSGRLPIVSRLSFVAFLGIWFSLASIVGSFRQYPKRHVLTATLALILSAMMVFWSSTISDKWQFGPVDWTVDQWQWLSWQGMGLLAICSILFAVVVAVAQLVVSLLTGTESVLPITRTQFLVGCVVAMLLIRALCFGSNVINVSTYRDDRLICTGLMIAEVVGFLATLVFISRFPFLLGRISIVAAFLVLLGLGRVAEHSTFGYLGNYSVEGSMFFCGFAMIGVVLVLNRLPELETKSDSQANLRQNNGVADRFVSNPLFAVPMITLLVGVAVGHYLIDFAAVYRGQPISMAKLNREIQRDPGTKMDVVFLRDSGTITSFRFEFSERSSADALKSFEPEDGVDYLKMNHLTTEIDCSYLEQSAIAYLEVNGGKVSIRQLKSLSLAASHVVLKDVQIVSEGSVDLSVSELADWTLADMDAGQVAILLKAMKNRDNLASINISTSSLNIVDWEALVDLPKLVEVSLFVSKLPWDEIQLPADNQEKALSGFSIFLFDSGDSENAELWRNPAMLGHHGAIVGFCSGSKWEWARNARSFRGHLGIVRLSSLKAGELTQLFGDFDMGWIQHLRLEKSSLDSEDWRVIARFAKQQGISCGVVNCTLSDGSVNWKDLTASNASLENLWLGLLLDQDGEPALEEMLELAEETDVHFGFSKEDIRDDMNWDKDWDLRWAFHLCGRNFRGYRYHPYFTIASPDTDVETLAPEQLDELLQSENWIISRNRGDQPDSIYWPFLDYEPVMKSLTGFSELKRLALAPEWIDHPIQSKTRDLSWIGDLTQLEELRLGPTVNPADLTFLLKLPNLRAIDIVTYPEASDLHVLAKCKSLEELTLYGVPSGPMIKLLANIPTLRKLKIFDYQPRLGMHPKQIEFYIQKNCPNLEYEFVPSSKLKFEFNEELQQHRHTIIQRLREKLAEKSGEGQ